VTSQSDWRTGTVSLKYLKANATQDTGSILDWLRLITPIPLTGIFQPMKYRTLDPDAIRLDYLAAVAQEWESWGHSQPTEFVAALAMETKDSPGRDAITKMLTLLGLT